MKKVNIPWKKRKSMHYFRSLFTTRANKWSYNEKHFWLGWAFKDHEASYIETEYSQCVESYFKMLQEENNPFLKDTPLLWENQQEQQKREMADWLIAQQNDREFMQKLAEVFVATGKASEVKKILATAQTKQ